MLLTASLGNSAISYGLFEGTTLVRHGRVPVRDLQFLPDRIGAERFTQIAAASVTPSRTAQLVSLLVMNYNAPVLMAGEDLPYGIDIQCDEPKKVGADRLLNAIAAHARKQSAVIVADVGTAVTFDLVSHSGTFCGGAIAPGPDMMLQALREHTELLPDVSFEEPPSALGQNTTEAMRAGAFWGTVGLVESLSAAVSEGRGGPIPLVITGGRGEYVANEIGRTAEFLPALTLEGLALLVERGR